MHLSELNPAWTADDQIWLDRLVSLNVRHVEQLGSLLANPVGRLALERLQVPLAHVEMQLRKPLSARFGLSLENPQQDGGSTVAPLLIRERFAMGFAVGPEDRSFQTASFGCPVPISHDAERGSETSAAALTVSQQNQLPEEIVVGPANPFPARDQGRRGTCVAFTVAAQYQIMQSTQRVRPVVLSPQFLHYLAKANDDIDPDEDGTSLDAALRQLRDRGCCLESRLPYVPRHDLRQVYTIRGHEPAETEKELRAIARSRKIKSYRSIPCQTPFIKAELAANKPVGVGVAVYELAWYNSLARSRGEIALPIMEQTASGDVLLDTPLGGHAVVLVGYRDNSAESTPDSNRPGGGYFIFRNSWGENWAPGNEFGRGYGYIPYEYIDRFCLEAAVIDELVLTSAHVRLPKTSATQAAKKAVPTKKAVSQKSTKKAPKKSVKKAPARRRR